MTATKLGSHSSRDRSSRNFISGVCLRHPDLAQKELTQLHETFM